MQHEKQDVVVVGCGIAGLSAAVSAAENGARVTVLDRAPREERGGQSRYTEAYLRMKSETEVTDDFETHIAENGSASISPALIEESSMGMAGRTPLINTLSIADPEVIDVLAASAGPTVAWMKTHGVRFEFLPTQFLTATQPRLLPVGGGEAMIEALATRAEALSVKFCYDTAAQELAFSASRSVEGVWAKTRGGTLQVNPGDFTGFGMGVRFYPMLYLLTRVQGAKDFGTGLDLRATLLGRLSSLQVHHTFPKKVLYDAGYSRGEVNAVANFVFLTQDTNLAIGKTPPEQYMPQIAEAMPGVLDSQWIPADPALWQVSRYPDFLGARRALLTDTANADFRVEVLTPIRESRR